MKDWPHAPLHPFDGSGTYMVTGGTFHKRPIFASGEKKDIFLDILFRLAQEMDWELRAWALMPNHHHIIASSGKPSTLRKMIAKLHMMTAKQVNLLDHTPRRRVWFQCWDSRITWQRSYLARLKYVNNNPARHGLTDNAANYHWCSAAWFEQNATPAFRKTLDTFGIDTLSVADDY